VIDYGKIYGDWAIRGHFEIDPLKTALLVIDMQKCFCDPTVGFLKAYLSILPLDISYYVERLHSVTIPSIKRLLALFREKGLRIIHISTGAETDDMGDLPPATRRMVGEMERLSKLKVNYFRWAAEGQFLQDLAPRKGELVINKLSGSAFNSTNIDFVLHNMGIKYLVLTGVATHGCVSATGLDAGDRGYSTILVDDACATWTHELHESATGIYKVHWGKLYRSNELIDEIEAKCVSPS